MDSYFLIARNRKDNSFTVLKLREDWYLGQDKGRKDVLTRINDLEAIDLVTSRFASETEMADRMARHGYIPSSDVDVFIASKRKKDGKIYIKFDEVIYNRGKIVESLRRIAQTSLASSFKDDGYDLNLIYDKVISLAFSANDYLSMLLEGTTNVPGSFSRQLKNIRHYSEIPYNLKEQATFGADSYATVRNIVESINRLQQLGGSHGEDRNVSNVEFVENNLNKRLLIVPELSVQLENDFVEGQLSLFSMPDVEHKEIVQEETQKTVEDEFLIPAKIFIPRSRISEQEKRKEIYRVLRQLPINTLCKQKGSDEYKVNYALFSHYPPSDEERRKLDTYLTGNLPRYINRYIRDYGALCDVQNDVFSTSSEICDLQVEIEHDIRRIDNRFKSAKCLNMVYEWCMLLEGAHKRDKAVGEGAKVSSDIDDKGKVYAKK